MIKSVNIGDVEVTLTANAFTPIKYKNLFGEDLLVGLSKLSTENLDLDILSKLAYCMALQADTGVGSMEEWLSQFELTDFYNALPDILELWSMNNKTGSRPKKAQGK